MKHKSYIFLVWFATLLIPPFITQAVLLALGHISFLLMFPFMIGVGFFLSIPTMGVFAGVLEAMRKFNLKSSLSLGLLSFVSVFGIFLSFWIFFTAFDLKIGEFRFFIYPLTYSVVMLGSLFFFHSKLKRMVDEEDFIEG